MEISQIYPYIEALIFASDKPLNATDITELVNNALGFIEDRAEIDQVEAAIQGIRENMPQNFMLSSSVKAVAAGSFDQT